MDLWIDIAKITGGYHVVPLLYDHEREDAELLDSYWQWHTLEGNIDKRTKNETRQCILRKKKEFDAMRTFENEIGAGLGGGSEGRERVEHERTKRKITVSHVQ